MRFKSLPCVALASLAALGCSSDAATPTDAGIPADAATPVDAGFADASPVFDAASGEVPDAAFSDAMPSRTVAGEVWCGAGGLTIEANGVQILLPGSGAFAVPMPEAEPLELTIAEPPPGKQCEVVDTANTVDFDDRLLIRCWGPPATQLAYEHHSYEGNSLVRVLNHNFLDSDGCAAPARAAGPSPLVTRVRDFMFSGDSNALLYRGRVSGFAYQLFSVALSTGGIGESVQVNPETSASPGVDDIRVIPGASTVFFWSPDTDSEPRGFYVADLAVLPGETATRLSAPLLGTIAGNQNYAPDDGTKFVFTASPALASQNPFLWIANLTTAPPYEPQLINHIPPKGKGIYADFGAMSKDGSKVVYHEGQPRFAYVVDIASGTPGTPALAYDGESFAVSEGLTSDGDRLVLSTLASGAPALVVVDVSQNTPATPAFIDISLAPFGQIHDVDVAPAGRKLVYVAEGESQSIRDAYFVDISGAVPGPPIQLTSATAGVSSGAYSVWSEDGNNYVFRQGGALMWVDTSGTTPTAPVRINPPQPNHSLSGLGTFAPNGAGVLALGQHNTLDKLELLWIDLSSGTPSPPTLVGPELPDGVETSPPTIVGNLVVFRVRHVGEQGDVLYALPFDASGPGELQRISPPAAQTTGADAPRVLTFKAAPLPSN